MGGLLTREVDFRAADGKGGYTSLDGLKCSLDNFVYPSTKDNFNPAIDTYTEFAIRVNDNTFKKIKDKFSSIPLSELTVKIEDPTIIINHDTSRVLTVESSFSVGIFIVRVEIYGSSITAIVKDDNDMDAPEPYPMICHINPTPTSTESSVFQSTYQFRVPRSIHNEFRERFRRYDLSDIGFTDFKVDRTSKGFPQDIRKEGFLITELVATNIQGIFTITVILTSITYDRIIHFNAFFHQGGFLAGGTIGLYKSLNSIALKGSVTVENNIVTRTGYAENHEFIGFPAVVRIPISEFEKLTKKDEDGNDPQGDKIHFIAVLPQNRRDYQGIRATIISVFGDIPNLEDRFKLKGRAYFRSISMLLRNINLTRPELTPGGNIYLTFDDEIPAIQRVSPSLQQARGSMFGDAFIYERQKLIFAMYNDFDTNEIVLHTLISSYPPYQIGNLWTQLRNREGIN